MKEQEHEGYSFCFIHLNKFVSLEVQICYFLKFNTRITLFWCYLYCLLLSAHTDIFSGVPYAVFLLQKRDVVMQS